MSPVRSVRPNIGDTITRGTSVRPAPTPNVKITQKPALPAAPGHFIIFSAIKGVTSPAVLIAPLVFQCPPIDSFPQDYSWAWEDYTTIDWGEPRKGRHGGAMHSNPSSFQLASYTFQTLLVDRDAAIRVPFEVYPLSNSLMLAKDLRAIGDSMTPFKMQVGSPQVWTAWEPLGKNGAQAVAVTMRSLRIEERAGEPDTRYVTISVTEFADAPLQPPAGAAGTNTVSTADLPRGTSLADLAQAAYGRPSDWKKIAKASGLTHTGQNDDLSLKSPPVKIVIPSAAVPSKKPTR